MSLSGGDKLGPYEIVAPIGAGGMGEVYEAREHGSTDRRDQSLDGSVLPALRARSRAVAALNHSNICTLHDVGPDYLVMEYIQGTPLRALCRSTRR